MYQNKPISRINKIGSFLVTALIVLIIGYIVYNISHSVWHNYEINQKISNLKEEINKLKIKNKNLLNLIVYYQSNTFKELEARRKLGLKKKDETMIIIPENNGSLKNSAEFLPDSSNQQNNQNMPVTPNYLKWRNFVIGG